LREPAKVKTEKTKHNTKKTIENFIEINHASINQLLAGLVDTLFLFFVVGKR